MQKDYKMFPPSVNWDNIDWSTRRPVMDFPVQVSLRAPFRRSCCRTVLFAKNRKILQVMLETMYCSQSAICSLDDVSNVKPGKVSVLRLLHLFGPQFMYILLHYKINNRVELSEVSGGGRGIERVDVATDGGKTWAEASKSQKAGMRYISDDETSDKWAWVLFEAKVDIPQSTEIVVKAVCYSSTLLPVRNRKRHIRNACRLFH